MAQKRFSNSQHEWQVKQENLLIAIDQLEQLAEVMSEMLARVKHQVRDLEGSADITRKTMSPKKIKTESRSKKRIVIH